MGWLVTITWKVVLGWMNGKEKFAGAVLVVTLTIGLIVDVVDSQPGGNGVSRQVPECPAGSITGGNDAFRKIDLNTAGAEEFEILPGIGPKKAEAIVEYRKRNGCFRSLSQLIEVKGIGEKTLERITPYVVVVSEGSSAGD
jgi:comEA protein